LNKLEIIVSVVVGEMFLMSFLVTVFFISCSSNKKINRLKEEGVCEFVVVEGLGKRAGADGYDVFYPVVRFKDGSRLGLDDAVLSSEVDFELGDEIELYYKSENGEIEYILNDKKNEMLPFFFMVIGAVIILIMILVFIKGMSLVQST